MRAPPDPGDVFESEEKDSDDEDERTPEVGPVGAFPGTKAEYAANSSYY
jgi:hypothetical protein